MRLTLRTLLAYLDNTLDPQDAEALRDKLGESGFATQLVQRIRGTLASGSIPAPSPQAVGPVEEANVISEYLDSTLPSEQVAEIERACLESDPHLAEAAACHQILTMVLGQPAEVSPELRRRIYELPDRKIEDIAVAGSFSSVAIPVEEPQLKSLTDDIPTADATAVRQGEPVRPVGVSDSGVSDAPTRLREAQEAASGQAGLGAAAVAGSRARSVDSDAMIYAGSIRPSRIAPWLVSLALAGVLLFALTRIFQPLLNPKTASVGPQNGIDIAESIGEIEVAAEDAPIMIDVDASTSNVLESQPIADTTETLPPPPAVTKGEPDSEQTATASKSEESAPAASSTAATGTQTTPPPATAVANVPTSDGESPENVAAEKPPATTSAPPASPTPPPMTKVAGDADQPVTPPPADAIEAGKREIAKVTSDETLLAALIGDHWVRLKKDVMVPEGLMVVCAPTFRGEMATDHAVITVVGPARFEWLAGEEDDAVLDLKFGRVLVSATTPEATVKVRLADETVQVRFSDIESVAAASMKHYRAPGFDPLEEANRIPLAGVLAVQGRISLLAEEKEETLETGQQWVKRGSTPAKISPVESVPDWIDPPDPAEPSLESTARSGLLELLKGDQPLEIALRESTLFRRSEVGALAGRTLLNLDLGDVYFGGDGILSEPKQRAYWPDHYVSLMAAVDRSAESARQLQKSVFSMDSANAMQLMRLLTGFSQKQLNEGGDEELVDLLDSPSMAVRVLALENLHKITGKTLYFRAEQDNAVRRAPIIKKWQALQRKGDIRWQE